MRSPGTWALSGSSIARSLVTHLRRVLMTMRRHGVLNDGGQHLVGRPDDGELTVGVALKAAAISHDTVHRYSLLRLATDPTPAPHVKLRVPHSQKPSTGHRDNGHTRTLEHSDQAPLDTALAGRSSSIYSGGAGPLIAAFLYATRQWPGRREESPNRQKDTFAPRSQLERRGPVALDRGTTRLCSSRLRTRPTTNRAPPHPPPAAAVRHDCSRDRRRGLVHRARSALHRHRSRPSPRRRADARGHDALPGTRGRPVQREPGPPARGVPHQGGRVWRRREARARGRRR